MSLIKKLAFAPLFMLFLAFFCYLLNPLLNDLGFLFSLDINIFLQLLQIGVSLILTALFYVVFLSLARDIKIVAPISLFASLVPLLLLNTSYPYIASIGVLISFLIIFLMVESNLKSYLNFQPTVLFNHNIKTLVTLILISFALMYYFITSGQIKEKGFQIPDSLIDASLKIVGPTSSFKPMVKGERYLAQGIQITPEQLQLLKNNPELLKQYGISPSDLDKLQTTQKTGPANQNTVNKTGAITLDPKALIKDRFNTIIKQYESIIPIVLSVMFFLSLQFITSFLSILISPLLLLIYAILEKSGYIRFEKEMREVKKLVV